MNIFLTGGNGFIGKHLKNHLIGAHHDITTENELPFFNSPSIVSYDAIMHLAACNYIGTDFNPRLVESNYIYANEMLSTAYRTIFASSTSAQELNNPYAYSKAYGEYLCSQHRNALALRLFNVYGPGGSRGIVKALLDAAYSGAEVEIQSGAQIRDFIYVEDVCALMLQMLESPTGIIDIGTGTGTSINELIKLVKKVTGRQIKVKRTKFDIIHQQGISVARTMPQFNYTQLEDGLRKTIQCDYQ